MTVPINGARAILLCLPMLVLSSCLPAARAPREKVAARQLVSWTPIPGRNCRTRPPTVLPPPAALVDVATLDDSLRTARLRQLRGRIVFSIVYDSIGLRHSEVVQTTFDDTTRAAITRVMDGVIRKNWAAPEGRWPNWGWQLAIDFAERPALEVGHQELCYPALRSGTPVWEQRRGISQSAAYRPVTERDRMIVRIRVDERGRAEGAIVRPSMTGRFDRAVSSIIASQSYWPMLVDRIPVAWEFEERFP